MFKTWLLKAKNQFINFMKALYINKKREFILTKLKIFCKKKNIIIKYVLLYIYNENDIINRKYKIIVIIKNILLIDSSLFIKF